MLPSAKRHKASDDDATTVMASSVQPKLSMIAKLVLVDLRKEDPNEVEEALEALFSMVPSPLEKEKWKEVREELVHTGAPATVIAAMHKWPLHKGTQESGCACLATLLGHDDTAPSISVALSGGVETIVNALKAFPDDICLYKDGLVALMNFFDDLEDDIPPAMQSAHRFFEEMDGIDLVQNAMKNFADDADVQGDCCGILVNLAEKEEFHEALTKAGIMVEVSMALRDHPEDDDVKRYGKGFLRKVIG